MTRSLVESALLAALGTVLVLFGYYIPLLGPIAVFLWPIPSALVVLRHGVRWGFLSSIVTGLSLLLFMDWLTAIGLWVLFALTGVSFGYAVAKNYSPVAIILITSVAFLAGVLTSLASVYLVAGFTPGNLVDSYIKAMESAVDINQKLLGDTPFLEQFSNLSEVRDQLIRILPGAILLSALFQAYVNFEVARRVLERIGHSIAALEPFSRWIFPEFIAHSAIISYLLLMFEPYHKIVVLSRLGENALIVLALVLFVQTASVVSYYLKRLNIPKFFTGLAILYMFISPGLNTLAVLFGIVDILFDFRRLRYGWVDEM